MPWFFAQSAKKNRPWGLSMVESFTNFRKSHGGQRQNVIDPLAATKGLRKCCLNSGVEVLPITTGQLLLQLFFKRRCF